MMLRQTLLPSRLLFHYHARRPYSVGTPLSEIHAQLRDVEEMFAKYRLDLIEDPAQIDKLEKDGNIPKVLADNLRNDIKHRQEATKAAKFYVRMFWMVGMPVMGLIGWNAYNMEMEHLKHMEKHPMEEHINYPHLRILNKRYWWGDGKHTLFHTEKFNGP